MNLSKLSPKLLVGVLLVLFLAIALYFRVYLPYDKVFSGDWIKFSGSDIYNHMRLVDNLVYNFPHLTTFDPYMIYPGGAQVAGINFFERLLAGIIWVIGLGSPTQHTIDVVGVYFPAVLGALTVIPVYFIGRELFGRWAGVLSAGLIALLPGEFLGRSILGSTDNHVAEVLFTTVTMLFLILAIKTASQRELTFSHLKRRYWATSAKPIIYSLLAGFSLGIYLLSWAGGLLFIFIISIYFVIQSIIDHLRHKSIDYLCLVGFITFFIAAIMFLPVYQGIIYLAGLVIAPLIPPVLSGLSRLLASKAIKPAYYPLAVVGAGLAGLAILFIIDKIMGLSLLRSIFAAFQVFTPTGASLTTMEMRPLLFPAGKFSFAIAWGNFTTGFFLSFISLGILIYLIIKRDNTEKSLLVVWSLIILVATLGQRRFGYYLAVNVALLTGYLSVLVYCVIRLIIDYLRGESTDHMTWQILGFAGFKEVAAKPVEAPQERDYYEVLRVARRASSKEIKRAFRKLASNYHPDRNREDGAEERFKEISEAYEVLTDPRQRAAYDRSRYGMTVRKKAKPKRGYPSGFRNITRYVAMSLGVIAIFFLVFFPNIAPARLTANQVPYAPSDAWCSSLSWLKENTPEPFGDPDFYYHLETNNKYRSLYWMQKYEHYVPSDPDSYEGNYQIYPYPESAYGVMAWWDYGYWITRIAHRIPNANPSQDRGPIISVASFFTSQDENSANEITQELGTSYIIIDFETTYSKFYAIALWAGREQTEYSDVYYVLQENQLRQVQLYYPEYYRSLSARLYNFDGKAVTPESIVVISYEEKLSQEGEPIKVITSAEQFESYEEAEAYLLSQESANYKIVGTNPFISPVPLEALEHYKLIHSSESSVAISDVLTVPAVKIFEYIGTD